MSRRARFSLALLCVAVTYAGAARAGSLCGDVEWQARLPGLRLATARSPALKVNFISDRTEKNPQCPRKVPACAKRAIIVPGDEVLTAMSEGPLICALYMSAQGIATTGWLPLEDMVFPDPVSALPTEDWSGSWKRDEEANIELKAVGDRVHMKGVATWGGRNSQRVAKGLVNTGEFSASAAPRGNLLSNDPAYDGTESLNEAGKSACLVAMKRLGRYLAVSDNSGCGGMNVTFGGIYVRDGK